MKDCVMRTLDNPLLNGIALGLAISDEGQCSVQPGIFPCCAAEGKIWHEQGQGYRTCSMKTRLRATQKLLAQFRKTWPQASRGPHQVPPQWGAQTLQDLAAVLRHDRPKGTLCYSPQRHQPSQLWSKALATCWRFGVETRILHLQDAKLTDLTTFTQDGKGPLALFVEQVDKLWDPLLAERVEFIVQRAYNAEAFIWLDLIADSVAPAEESHDGSLKSSLHRKLAKLRSQHPLDSLSKDCLSRLQSLCGGPLRPHSGDS